MKQKLSIDCDLFDKRFPLKPFTIKHDLASSPLFQLPRLIELSKALPASSVEYNSGQVPVTLDPSKTPRTGLSIEETIRRIEECRSWMALKLVELDKDYKALLDECLDQIAQCSDGALSKHTKREGFIFISSPGSVTPYHMDPEHNFLLQVRGNKTIYMWDQSDRTVLAEEEIERFYSGAHRNLTFRDEFQAKAREFLLEPGDGLHFPLNDPHWVKNGDAVSISFSITFRSPVSERRARLYHVNGELRKRGFAPTPVGHSALVDATKDAGFRVLRRAQHLFGKQAPEQASY